MDLVLQTAVEYPNIIKLIIAACIGIPYAIYWFKKSDDDGDL